MIRLLRKLNRKALVLALVIFTSVLGGYQAYSADTVVYGTMSGTGTITDNAIVRWDGTSSSLLQSSALVCDDDGLTTLTSVMDNATGNEVALKLNYTTNKLTSGSDTGLEINMTDTASPGTSYGINYKVGGTSVFSVTNGGTISASKIGTVGAGNSLYIFDNSQSAALSPGVRMGSGTWSSTSGTNVVASVYPIYNQTSGTASNYDFRINRTETAIGSGTQRLLSAGTGGASYVEKFAIDNTGMHWSIPPSAQTIAAGNTITANACGGLKQITADGSVTTSTTNTFTAPASTNSGCCMDVVNVGANNITLDNNANFYSAGAADVVLGAADTVRVCSNGTYWYQIGATGNN